MFSSSSSSYLIHALSSLWPLSSIQLTGFAAAFVQWDISINSSATWLLVVLFLLLLPFCRKKIRSASPLSFCLGRIWSFDWRLQDIVRQRAKTNGMAEFFVDSVSSLLLWLLWFSSAIMFFTLLPQLVCSCYLHRLLLLSLYCCCYGWWIRNNTSRCTEPNSSLLLLCKFCTLPRVPLLLHLCCRCHGRRSLSSIKQPRLLSLFHCLPCHA